MSGLILYTSEDGDFAEDPVVKESLTAAAYKLELAAMKSTIKGHSKL